MKTRSYVVCLVLLAFLGGSVVADVYNYWWGNTDSDWFTGSNWSLGIVPSRDNANPHWAHVTTGTSNISSNTGADRFTLGAVANEVGTLNVTGGSDFSVKFELFFGTVADSAGILNLDGTAYCEVLHLGAATGATGTINIANGGTMTCGWWGTYVGEAGTGIINLNGTGNLTVYDSQGTATDGLVMTSNGHIDLEAGVIAVNGNYQTRLQGYIDNGWITAYDGTGTVNDAFFDVNTGYTTITAIVPEPATMLMLGLGGLLLGRRKKHA